MWHLEEFSAFHLKIFFTPHCIMSWTIPHIIPINLVTRILTLSNYVVLIKGELQSSSSSLHCESIEGNSMAGDRDSDVSDRHAQGVVLPDIVHLNLLRGLEAYVAPLCGDTGSL